MSKYIIQAGKAALPFGQFAELDRFLADGYSITMDIAHQNAAVTHSRSGAVGVTLRVSAYGLDLHSADLGDDNG
jgi:hypothetical protein